MSALATLHEIHAHLLGPIADQLNPPDAVGISGGALAAGVVAGAILARVLAGRGANAEHRSEQQAALKEMYARMFRDLMIMADKRVPPSPEVVSEVLTYAPPEVWRQYRAVMERIPLVGGDSPSEKYVRNTMELLNLPEFEKLDELTSDESAERRSKRSA